MVVSVEKLNRLGLNRDDYKGAHTTLCAGCGHDSISARSSRPVRLRHRAARVAKLSGIGCSSKTPTYFLRLHGFNSVHGRMPLGATGAKLANRDLIYFGVSGDGDTASIGLGQFCHMIRRGVNMTYIVENNGVYGLTKGQFSATADLGTKAKRGVANRLPPIDRLRPGDRARRHLRRRSFSGDKASSSSPLIKAALRASRGRGHRRDQALRHVQQPRGRDQELRLRQGPRRPGQQARLHRTPARRSPSTTSRAAYRPSSCTTAPTSCSARSTPTTTPGTRSPPCASSSRPVTAARSSPGCCT